MEFSKDWPQITFIASRFNMYSPAERAVYYDSKRSDTNAGRLGLLHEIGHAVLGHQIYKYDMELLNLEMDAWDFVREQAPRYGLAVDEEHIARSIATYDEWLSKRATCPDCRNFSLQKDRSIFGCFACGSKWQVNRRLDKRVKRTVTERWEPIHLHLPA